MVLAKKNYKHSQKTEVMVQYLAKTNVISATVFKNVQILTSILNYNL